MANEAEVPVGFMPAAEVAGPSCLNAIGLFLEQGRLDGEKIREIEKRLYVDRSYADHVRAVLRRRLGEDALSDIMG